MKKTVIDFKTLPDAPGVYRFLGPKKEVVYVGKATSLRDRLKSYFSKDIAEIRSPLIAKIVEDARAIDWKETDSVLDALVLEAKLIKKHQPVGNTDQKDNKSWAYLVITKERFPRVLIARERELTTRFSRSITKELFGPFPSSGTLRKALRVVRRIFPFFDSSFPISNPLTPAQGKTVRFNQSIGLYPSDCNDRTYRKTIRAIVDIFSARKYSVIRRLEREMHAAAKRHAFERADELKRKVFALKHIQDVTLIKEELRAPETATFRIEAYDVAHIRGAAPRGVMVVVEDGEADPKGYRTFIVRSWQKQKTPHVRRRTSHMPDVRRQALGGDDYAALDEMLERRAKHREWPYPQLIVIDGGKAHLNRAKKTLKDNGMGAVEVVSVVKDERHRPREILGSQKLALIHEADILLANGEAHRFAISKHRRALRGRL